MMTTWYYIILNISIALLDRFIGDLAYGYNYNVAIIAAISFCVWRRKRGGQNEWERREIREKELRKRKRKRKRKKRKEKKGKERPR